MSGNPLNNDNKTDLLFKKFQGVIQSAVDTDDTNNPAFTIEDKKSLVNIFQEDIFSQPVPRSLPKTLLQLWGDTSISDSSWNTNPGDQTLSFVDLSNSSGASLPLRFYKRVYLNNISTTGQSWWLLDPSGSGANSTTNNLLRDTIPFLYNDELINTYRPIVEHWDGTQWQSLDQATYPNFGNWLMDAASGVLQFYDSTANLSSLNISNTPSGEKDRPRISFIKYTGIKGAASGGSGGAAAAFKAGDFSGTDISFQDVSAVLFNKKTFDVSYVNGAAQIDLQSSFGNGIADISYYFFDKPNAPFNGDGSLNNTIGTGTITCTWTNPPNTKSALPFGLAPQYPDNQDSTQPLAIGHLPFFKELCIQYKQFFPTPSGDWTDISVNVFPKTIIPNTVTELWASSGGLTTDLCGNGTGGKAPYYRVYTNQLQLGKGYQFRIFLKNDSIETGLIDPLYGGDASYNYLYIPNVSGGNIELGNFGPPVNPFIGDISFINTSFLEFDVRGINIDPSGADASLNTPFPINPALSLRVFYGFDISCVRDPSSVQAHALYDATKSVQIRDLPNTTGTRENNFTIQGNWETGGGDLISDLSWAPQHKYTINRFLTKNNTLDFSNIEADVSNVVPVIYTTPIPSRADINTPATTLMPSGNVQLKKTDVSGIDISFANAYSYSSIVRIDDVPFLNNNIESFSFNLPRSSDFMLTDTSVNTAPFIGTDVSGQNLCYLRYDISNAPPGAGEYDVSTNTAVGTINTSGFVSSNLTIPTVISANRIFNAINLVEDARPFAASSVPSGVKGNYNESGGYYLNLIQNRPSGIFQRLSEINLTKLRDICNNGYEPYISRVRQYYNDGTGLPFKEHSDQRIATFKMALKDSRVLTYTLNPFLNKNPTVALNNYLMGISRPATGTAISDASYGYILTNIHNFWRTQINISQDKLVYRPNDSSPANYTMGTSDNSWNTIEQKTITTASTSDFPNSQFDLKALAQPSGSSNRRYSRQYSTSPQFEIKTTHFNNPTILPLDISNTYDISFGTPGKDLWWDFTYEGTTQNTTGSAVNLPRKSDNTQFFTTNVSSVAGTYQHVEATTFNSGGFSTTDYTHSTDLTTVARGNYQIVWANYGFRGASTGTTGANDPYVNYAGTYYNSGTLPNYLPLKTTFDTISETYTPGGSKQWWNDNTLNVTLTRNVKYLTFNVEHPYINDTQITQFGSGSTNYGYQLVIGGGLSKDNNTTPGYLVYHKENSAASGISIMYDGQGRDGTGNGSWNATSGGTPDAYVIKTSSGTSGIRTKLQITIGVPNSITNAVIDSVRINFVKW